MKITCEICQGKGEVLVDGKWTKGEEWIECENCSGKGYIEISDNSKSEDN